MQEMANSEIITSCFSCWTAADNARCKRAVTRKGVSSKLRRPREFNICEAGVIISGGGGGGGHVTAWATT